MAFPNAKRLLKNGLSLSTFKLLAMQASISRPQSRRFYSAMFRPFIHDGEVEIRYRCHGRHYAAFIRMSDIGSDLFTVKELAADGAYHLDPGFVPDLIVDGGGNIGLFSLRAQAAYPSAKIIICEPVPRSITQIKKHLQRNGVQAEILPVCLGGSRRQIPFYIREAIGSSFDPEKPYIDRIDVDVITLADVLQNREARRILIKLDIEGMEIEVLQHYVPGETRPVCIVGELHNRKANGRRLQQIFEASGWTLLFQDASESDSIFEARSPAASVSETRPSSVGAGLTERE